MLAFVMTGGKGERLGEEPEEDARRFHVDRSGIVVIPRGGRAHTLALEDAP